LKRKSRESEDSRAAFLAAIFLSAFVIHRTQTKASLILLKQSEDQAMEIARGVGPEDEGWKIDNPLPQATDLKQ